MQEFLTSLLDILGLAWWVEITTEAPRCTYYFGPFSSHAEAEAAKPGYVEDLQSEDAQGISVVVKRCKPERLTISDDVGELRGKVTPSFSSPVS
ncbi:MAG: DUF1816 domain-containing protein [Leptolyngbyaceae cyanobacterium bins.349]|nr:DUF1816 domain-containing protein [Leptolyngbyaceae cyanobacterium bins.349]